MKGSQQKKRKKVNNQDFPINLYFMFLVLMGILGLALFNYDLLKRTSELDLNTYNSQYSPAPYPLLNINDPLDISAAGAVVLDSDSHVLIFSKNPTRFFSPASTTKILTALVALDNFKLDQVMTVYSEDIEGSNVGLKSGDKLTLENLLYAMMLPSSNEAAVAIADNFPAGREAFVQEMNKKARTLGLYSTHLKDPVGLRDEENITTPHDLAILGDIAMKSETISRIAGTKSTMITTVDGKKIDVSNLNVLLGLDGVEGVKTGFTETSGEVLVTSRLKDGKRIIVVVMQSVDRFGDTLKIIDRLNSGLTYLATQP